MENMRIPLLPGNNWPYNLPRSAQIQCGDLSNMVSHGNEEGNLVVLRFHCHSEAFSVAARLLSFLTAISYNVRKAILGIVSRGIEQWFPFVKIDGKKIKQTRRSMLFCQRTNLVFLAFSHLHFLPNFINYWLKTVSQTFPKCFPFYIFAIFRIFQPKRQSFG